MARNATVLPRRRLLRITGGLAAPFIVPALAADRLVVNGYGAEFQEIITRTARHGGSAPFTSVRQAWR
jgi:hypothetical protein